MNAEEKQLIEDLFARLRNFDGGDKDLEAQALIQDLVRRSPDAPYYLAQTVIVQQQAVERAEARIRELEGALRQQQQQTGRGGSFLGGASVPQSGSRYASSPQAAPSDAVPPAQPSSPWGSPARPAGGGGFLSSALSTAAGVAGGVFLADGIRSLFGGGAGGQAWAGGGGASAADQKTIDNLQDQAQDADDDRDQAQRDLADADATQDDMQDAQDDDDSWGNNDDFDV
ncbi:DUF2076 domain-containing protein [Hyphomicrobium sp. 99]|uniref:DUF2076 domain-containing protein n=1 Tax=Hyphomicrobium sp. 99 TaxID=1163419 RepID=UPI0005F85B98|nr:DUF2076 domain-containing protein [Hyphomicrobium sp. 99]